MFLPKVLGEVLHLIRMPYSLSEGWVATHHVERRAVWSRHVSGHKLTTTDVEGKEYSLVLFDAGTDTTSRGSGVGYMEKHIMLRRALFVLDQSVPVSRVPCLDSAHHSMSAGPSERRHL